jgi:hypothetical protein
MEEEDDAGAGLGRGTKAEAAGCGFVAASLVAVADVLALPASDFLAASFGFAVSSARAVVPARIKRTITARTRALNRIISS